eukprot:TRINITY_DN4092_c0_g8_i1.p1 TRINITY_DN4092_c0_g8~~TRINITY_DN4092_c0_g8_i1.p1  ORF type:complete len:251 (-),score=41.78 TRINITY_DN4092_c0_g8_i1:66-818(-)
MSIPGSDVDFTGFFHAVIANLACRPDCSNQLYHLGQDPAVQATWAALGQPKSQTKEAVLNARPDLFARTTSWNGKETLKLQALGLTCLPPSPIPPFGSSPAPIDFQAPIIPGGSTSQPRQKGGGPWTFQSDFRNKGYEMAPWGWNGKGGKGKGGNFYASPPRQEGPNLPREPLVDGPFEGEVLEWKGKFGWLKPSTPIDHPKAAKHNSRVYVHIKDLSDGLTSLRAGSRVQFQAYADDSGLGAEAIVVLS